MAINVTAEVHIARSSGDVADYVVNPENDAALHKLLGLMGRQP